MFQSPRSGKFVSDSLDFDGNDDNDVRTFQSPRSGKFVSDMTFKEAYANALQSCFNPLDRGNLYQIYDRRDVFISAILSFNPLDRGNLYQIAQKTLVN